MASYESRMGDIAVSSNTSGAYVMQQKDIVHHDVNYWLSGQTNITPNMGTKDAGIAYSLQTLDTMISTFKNILNNGEQKFDWSQKQYYDDQLVLEAALRYVMNTKYSYNLLSNADYVAKRNALVSIVNSINKFNPDVGQAYTLQSLVDSGQSTVKNIAFTPAFTVDKTAIVVSPTGVPFAPVSTPPVSTPPVSTPPVSNQPVSTPLNTYLMIGVAALAAFFAFKR